MDAERPGSCHKGIPGGLDAEAGCLPPGSPRMLPCTPDGGHCAREGPRPAPHPPLAAGRRCSAGAATALPDDVGRGLPLLGQELGVVHDLLQEADHLASELIVGLKVLWGEKGHGAGHCSSAALPWPLTSPSCVSAPSPFSLAAAPRGRDPGVQTHLVSLLQTEVGRPRSPSPGVLAALPAACRGQCRGPPPPPESVWRPSGGARSGPGWWPLCGSQTPCLRSAGQGETLVAGVAEGQRGREDETHSLALVWVQQPRVAKPGRSVAGGWTAWGQGQEDTEQPARVCGQRDWSPRSLSGYRAHTHLCPGCRKL